MRNVFFALIMVMALPAVSQEFKGSTRAEAMTFLQAYSDSIVPGCYDNRENPPRYTNLEINEEEFSFLEFYGLMDEYTITMDLSNLASAELFSAFRGDVSLRLQFNGDSSIVMRYTETSMHFGKVYYETFWDIAVCNPELRESVLKAFQVLAKSKEG